MNISRPVVASGRDEPDGKADRFCAEQYWMKAALDERRRYELAQGRAEKFLTRFETRRPRSMILQETSLAPLLGSQ